MRAEYSLVIRFTWRVDMLVRQKAVFEREEALLGTKKSIFVERVKVLQWNLEVAREGSRQI